MFFGFLLLSLLALLSDDVEPFRGDLSDVDEAEGVEEAPLPSPSLLSTTWGTVLLDASERDDDEDVDDDDEDDDGEASAANSSGSGLTAAAEEHDAERLRL